MDGAHQKIQRCNGLIFLKYEWLAEFLVLMISLLAAFHLHCPHLLWLHLIETDQYKPFVDHENRLIFCVFIYGRSVPHYFDQYNRLIVISVIALQAATTVFMVSVRLYR
ncbi:hypothetical protein AVEN_11435-1 [Araneus ventricosus]|uniref:Uncharacterized protein n=1 Tax=Araneus ventricosus TaxID=182803 RepID=A0A4Y2PWS2_ARAVE|nr:hypothetical protein AVEN_11435-1 [Araneus ventricosus]